jgi:hypothetical protein
MKLEKKVIIPNENIGMITLTPVGDKIEVENANLGTMSIDADNFDTFVGDLQEMAYAINRYLDGCIEEQKDETYEETYSRICED